MFKFIVLCAFLAAARATPGAIIAPLAYSSNVLAPAAAVVSSYARSPIYSSAYIPTAPLAYSSPFGYSHFIKKRSVPLLSSYIAPSAYIASSPLAATYSAPLATSYSAPLAATYTAAAPLAATYTAAAPLATTYGHPIYATAAHLIKKRSAPLIVPSPYVAPSYVAPYAASYLPSTYAAVGPYAAAPLVSSAPAIYNTHFIK